MKQRVRSALFFISLLPCLLASQATSWANENPKISSKPYSSQELVDAGHGLFNETSKALAHMINNVVKQYGEPNAYILGEQASGALLFGLTYGEGYLYFMTDERKIYREKVFWQGPSLGFDVGAQGSRLMILVYNLNDIQDIWGRYKGAEGSAYILAGFSIKILNKEDIRLIPISTGIGGRLGLNVGYLKLTPQPTWNPL